MGRAVAWIVSGAVLLSTFFAIFIAIPDDSCAQATHSPITIMGDSDFTSDNGVTQGAGTVADPYVIEGYEISNESGTGIEVVNTDAFFVIRDCLIHNSSYGILLDCVSNATIDMCRLPDNTVSVVVTGSANVSVNNSVITAEHGCIVFELSTDCVAYSNSCAIVDEGASIATYQSRLICIEENSILGDRGNGLYIADSQDVAVKSNAVYGSGCQLEESYPVHLWSNAFLFSGIALAGTDVRAYDSLDIPTNNTVNGLPIHFVHSSEAGEYSFGDAGQIIVANCSDVEIRDSLVDQVAWSWEPWEYKGGIECYYSDRVAFSNMTVTGCANGLTLYQADNITLSDSTFLENWVNVQATSSDGTLATACVMTNSFTEGMPRAMSFWGSNFTRVVDCQIDFVAESDDPMALYRVGIEFHNIREASVQNCTIRNVDGAGVSCSSYMFQSDGLTVTGCKISECRWSAVEVDGTSDVLIENNSFALTDRAIDVNACVGVEIRNNSLILNEWCGLLLYDSDWCNVTGNWFAWNDGEGIMMEGSNITIAWNSFIESGVGIEGGRYDVLVHHNDFIQNRKPINPNVCYGTSWDDGYPSGGSYYSDYTGLDVFSGQDQDMPGSDGIGDSPYVHDSYLSYEDRYPLMSPALPHDGAPTALVESLPTSGDTMTLFEFNASGSCDPETPASDLWFRWDFDGDGTWDTGWTQEMSTTHEFLSAGAYSVTVQVLDPSGLNSTAAVSVDVVVAAIPEFSSSAVVVLAMMAVMIAAISLRRRDRGS